MTTTHRRETPATEPVPTELAAEVQRVLAGGGLAALGTETVYGLAARADLPAALQRLVSLKGRDANRGLTWHVGQVDALQAFEELPNTLQRLATRYWPGPLTLVLRGVPRGLSEIARQGWTALRCPAHEATRSILETLPYPVVMTSANRSGAPPLSDAAGVLNEFEGKIDLLVDSGPARIGESSTVLAVGRGRFEILREGLITDEDLRRTAGLAIGFVCTGNTCRSPMAEHLARHGLARRLDVAPSRLEEFGFRLISAGIMAGPGAPASGHAVEVLSQEGIDLSRHESRPARVEMIDELDRVYCLTQSHREALVPLLPPDRAQNLELLDPDGRDVPDPIGGSLEDYRRCADRIREALEARFADWL